MMRDCHGWIDREVRLSASFCSQSRCQGVDLLLQLGDATVGLLLSFPARGGDNACSVGFCASLAGPRGVVVIRLTFDFELSTCLAGTRSLYVIGIVWIR